MPDYKNTAGKKKPQKQNKIFNTIRLGIFWLIVILLGTAIYTNLAGNGTGKIEDKSITDILNYAKDEKLEKIFSSLSFEYFNKIHFSQNSLTKNIDMILSKSEKKNN